MIFGSLRNTQSSSNLMTKSQLNALGLTLGVFALVLGVRLHIIDAFAHFTPYYDDWGMGGTLQEYESEVLTLKFLLSPTNGHVGIWREFLQIGLFDLNQSQWDTYLQMVVNAIIWAINAVFLVTIARRHFTAASTPAVVFFVLILWIFPLSLINATWGVQTHNYNMILFSLVAIWFNQSDANTKAWWFGLLVTFMAPLTMGAGAIVAPATLGFMLVKLMLNRQCWPNVRPTIIAMFLLTIYSVWTLKRASSGHEALYATSVLEFLTTFSKALSFPVLGQVWAAPIMLAPIVILGIQSMRFNTLNNKAIAFTIVLSAYTIGLAIAIGHARGYNGGDPSHRYFEFFQMYILASLLALLLIQNKPLRINKIANSILVVAWVYTIFLGALDQVSYFNKQIDQRAINKPLQDDSFKRYLSTKDVTIFRGMKAEHIAFASGPGLASFVKKVEQEDIMSYQMQAPPPLLADGSPSGFVVNGTIAPNKDGWQYQYGYESAIGSYDRANGGGAAQGQYESTPHQYRRNHLMIPVTGYLGEPGLSLKLVDLKTGEETPVVGPVVDDLSAETWHEVFVETPENEFKIVALDNNPELWFGFAAPRTIGRLSYVSNSMIGHGKIIWMLGILILLFSLRDPLTKLLRPSETAS